jgi:hypothetical protein
VEVTLEKLNKPKIKLTDEIIEAISLAKDKTDWKKRSEALKILKCCKCCEVRDLLWEIALRDKIIIVRRQAYLILKGWGDKIYFIDTGRPYTSAEIKKALEKVRKRIKDGDIDAEVFSNALKKVNPEMYDVMLFENKLDILLKKLINQ